MDFATTVNPRSGDRRQDVSFFCAYHLGIKSGRRVNERRFNKEVAARAIGLKLS